MKANQKSSHFSTEEYVRPNLDWDCGHLCKGCPCRIGPSPKGKCRATYECEPFLKVKEGETKGHWTCTRPKSGGGKCENGPLPDGTCCNAIPKCQPRRTLRNIRKRAVLFTVIASLLVLFVGISENMRDEFVNPGPISSVHASEHFRRTHEALAGDASSCAACHDAAKQGVDTWYSKAFDAFKDKLSPPELVRKGTIKAAGMDQNCLSCHVGKDFHQPNMADDFSCQTCHKEHQGSGFMPEVDSNYCTACHGSEELMAKSRELGAGINPHSFPSFAANADLKIQPRERPEGGYTDVITAFHIDHPEFRQIKDKVIDQNTLKFNHEVHLRTGDIPRELSCTDCHEQDGRGEYQRPITFEKHCAECHSLKFEPLVAGDESKPGEIDGPGLFLPHGDPYYVRSFLRSLNIQYEEYGRAHEGITRKSELDEYVRENRKVIEDFYETGEFLERAVFFADMDGELPDGRRAPHAGCVACHEVTEPENDNATPLIKNVSISDRWMTIGKFNHSLHQKDLSCTDCHDVLNSTETSDLNLPSIDGKHLTAEQKKLGVKSCVDCHSPQGGIDHRCTTCHTYHNTQPVDLLKTFLKDKAEPEESGPED